MKSGEDKKPELICRYRKDGILSFVNKAYCSYFGKSEEELVGQTFLTLIPEEDIDPIKQHLASPTKDNPVVTFEHRVITTSGETRFLQWVVWAFFNKQGEIMEYQSVGRDITEQKQAEKELLAQKELLEGVINGIPDVLGIQTPDHVIERYNKAGLEMLGMTPEEVKGKKCYELIGREQECEKCATRMAMESKKLESIEKYFPEMDLYLECRSNPVLDKTGNVIRVVEQLRDITEQKRQEVRNQEERDYMFRMFDSMKQYVVVDSLDHRIEYLNQAAKNQFGDIIGETCYEILDLQSPCPDCPVVKIKNDDYIEPLHYSIGVAGRILEGTATKLVNLDGSISVLEVLEDVTERKQMEAVLRESERRYAQAYNLIRGIVESSKEIVIFALDRDYQYLAFNAKHQATMKQIWNVEIEVRRSMLEYIKNDADREKAKINFDRALYGEAFTVIEEYGDTAVDRRWYENIYSPLHDLQGFYRRAHYPHPGYNCANHHRWPYGTGRGR